MGTHLQSEGSGIRTDEGNGKTRSVQQENEIQARSRCADISTGKQKSIGACQRSSVLSLCDGERNRTEKERGAGKNGTSG